MTYWHLVPKEVRRPEYQFDTRPAGNQDYELWLLLTLDIIDHDVLVVESRLCLRRLPIRVYVFSDACLVASMK